VGIKSRIILFVLLFGIVAGGLLTFLNQFILTRSLLSIQEQQVKTSFDLGTLNLNSLISEMESSALSMAHFSAELYQLKKSNQALATDELFQAYLFNTFEMIKTSIGGGIWFEPFIFDQNKKWYGPYVYRENEELTFTWDLSNADYDYHRHSWYKDALNAENLNAAGVYWSEPYYDEEGSNALMVTVTAPFYDKEQLVGVTTVDWAISHLTKEITSLEFTESSSAFLMDKEIGIFLSFPNSNGADFQPVSQFSWGQRVLQDAKLNEILKLTEVNFNGQKGTIFFVAPRAKLVLGIFVPDSDYLEFIHQVVAKNLIYSAFIGVVFVFMLVYLLNRLFIPFDKILRSITGSISIDESNQSIKVSPIEEFGKKEFSSIIQALNQVYSVINEHSEKLELTNLKLREKKQEVIELNLCLEDKVKERTLELEQKTSEVIQVLDKLKDTQEQMILMEKNAALGQLVTGVAHEINTPLGICITASSMLLTEYQDFQQLMEKNTITKESLTRFMTRAHESIKMFDSNLQKTARLIDSFKKISTDQMGESVREFNLLAFLKLIVDSLKPSIEQAKVDVQFHVADDIEVESYSGVLSQVVTNLIMNSILHAFEGRQNNKITFDATLNTSFKTLEIRYTDNGIGMSDDVLNKIFEPFFTTRRGRGGTGLGMHITFNLVTQKLGGEIHIESTEEKGTEVWLRFPVGIVS
jgi:signal transduction histidine kinase